MQDKKLLIFLGSLGRGGAERVVSILSNYFCSIGWKIKIGLLLFYQVEYQVDDRIEIIDLAGKTQSRIKRLPGWIFSIRNLVKNEKPDIILAFAARINIIVQIACLGLKQKIIVSERNDPYSDGRSIAVDKMTRWLYPKAKAVVFQTKRAESYFNKYNLTNTVIITNPVTVDCLAAITKNDNKIVSVGRLTEQKNQKLLLDAFSKVVDYVPDLQLYLYGEGKLRIELENQVSTLGIDGNVHFMGNVSNIHEQIADASVFVLSSDYEGLSNALLEAMMMGLPCISTDCAGSDEYIRNEENGLLVSVGDSEELALAITKLIKDKNLAAKLGANAAKTSRIFAKETVLNYWYDLINEEV